MKVTGLNGKTYNLKLVRKELAQRSKGHIAVRLLIAELYPLHLWYEEVTLPGSGGLKSDFYLPELGLMIEVQGRQHEEYVKFFHKNKMGFLNSKKRDLNKVKWCELNQIRLVRLYDGDDWREKLSCSGD